MFFRDFKASSERYLYLLSPTRKMTKPTLRQLKAVKPGDLIEIPWKEVGNAYYLIRKNSGHGLTTSNMLIEGAKLEGYNKVSYQSFYGFNEAFKIIPGDSKKAKTIEGKFSA